MIRNQSGILTGCASNQEWLLKSWWNYYSQSNSYPVTFIDFGMTTSARLWCEKRGNVISVSPLHENQITSKEKISHDIQKAWETYYSSKVWSARPYWFAKPLALLKTPYEKTIWVDLDTFIIKSLEPVFDAAEKTGLALALEVDRAVEKGKKYNLHLPNEHIYNTGVISYTSPFQSVEKWAEKCLNENHLFMGDQDVLNRLIHEENIPVNQLSSHYNRRIIDGLTDETTVIHFANTGKQSLYIYLKT